VKKNSNIPASNFHLKHGQRRQTFTSTAFSQAFARASEQKLSPASVLTAAILPSPAFAVDAVFDIFFTSVCSKRRQKFLPTLVFPAVAANAGMTIPSFFFFFFFVFLSAFWTLAEH
jgi:hypothetical protein